MTYRDDHDALRSYHGHLVEELARLEAKASELAGVQADRARITAELARVRRDLEQQRARRSPIRLDNLRVASPCKESWDRMTGDERVRDCARCEKPVYNLSNMSTAEAEDLLASRGITACVRFYRRVDGTVMTQDCPVGARSQRRSLAIAAGLVATATAAGGAAALISSSTGKPSQLPIAVPDDGHEVIMGEMEMPDHELMGKIAPPPHEVVQGGIGPAIDHEGDREDLGTVDVDRPEPAPIDKTSPHAKQPRVSHGRTK